MKLVKPFGQAITTCSCVVGQKRFLVSRLFGTKEQKARLQYLASAIAKSVMPSADKNRKVSEEKSTRIFELSVETSRLNFFFLEKLKQQR